MMGRIKFGSDDEDAAPPPKEEVQVDSTVETVKFESKDDDDEEEVKIGRRTSRRGMYSFSLFFRLLDKQQ